MWSEIIAAAVGSLMTFIGYKYKNRVQTMKCYMHPDDILSKISSVIDGVEYNNIYIKEFTLKNTTNKDYL